MRKFEVETLPLGINNTGYPGAFTSNVEAVIKSVIYGRILHLYSGRSLIGDVRVDLKCPEATHNITIEEFITNDNSNYDWLILDPPYEIAHKDKLREYCDNKSLSGNIQLRHALKKYCIHHVQNVLWLDQCAPNFGGFARRKLWILIPGGWMNVRVLSWLQKEMELLL
jgi:hypothetical protein